VRISIFRSALEKPEEFKLVRSAIRKPYIESYVAEPKIGYVRILHLRPGVVEEMEKKLDSFEAQQVNNLILDLRGCTDEDQDLAVKVADLFIGASTIVQIGSRATTTQTILGDNKIAFQGNLLVLTDYTTAGSAEIIAGGIQDSGAGKGFGLRTFGRGGIRRLLPAGENYVFLTTQKYMTPKGKTILMNGIEPAIPFKEDVKKADGAEEKDQILEKAIEYLRYPAQKAA
jgi:carboxyl-terminal processing protease